MRTRYLAALRLGGTAALLTVAYYLLPTRGRLTATSWTVLFTAGVIVLGVLVLVHVGGLLRAGPEVSLQRLFVLLCVTVFFFAEVYYLLSVMPGQVADLRTKTDALYFTITTLSTVGYGDVHAVGQLARVAVTVQIVVDLFFIGTAVAVASGILRAKAARIRPHHGEQAGETNSATAARSGTADPGPGPAGGSHELTNDGQLKPSQHASNCRRPEGISRPVWVRTGRAPG